MGACGGAVSQAHGPGLRCWFTRACQRLTQGLLQVYCAAPAADAGPCPRSGISHLPLRLRGPWLRTGGHAACSGNHPPPPPPPTLTGQFAPCCTQKDTHLKTPYIRFAAGPPVRVQSCQAQQSVGARASLYESSAWSADAATSESHPQALAAAMQCIVGLPARATPTLPVAGFVGTDAPKLPCEREL